MIIYKKNRKFVINKPILSINTDILKENKISINELKKYFPRYILHPSPVHYSLVKNIFFKIVQLFLGSMVKILLRPRKSNVGHLDLKEVDDVYRREAATYNKKHHLTTRGMDLAWRRNIGWFIAVNNIGKSNSVKILDLCTGTGLTIREICKILEEWDINASVVGLDYNLDMLKIAETSSQTKNHCVVNFVRGDAMDLVRKKSNFKAELTQFENTTFDYIVQMFGIGGISDPVKEFIDILQILKPDGKYFLIDMHKPIPELPGELPVFFRWLQFPSLETFIYEQTTIPLVLNKLWGWRDTTLCFYLLSLIVHKDDSGIFWGFEAVYLEQESQRWWFALPFMPTAKIIVKKVIITKEEADKRHIILKSCTSQLIK